VKTLLSLAVAALAAASASAQPANPLTGGARINSSIIKDFVTRVPASSEPRAPR
jgi:hypothetical protein